jgi:uroporphyrinogen-III synthase
MNPSSNSANPRPLAGWTVVAISTAAQNARLGRAARDAGAGFVGLPLLRLSAAVPGEAHAGDEDLRRAIASPQCVFTSPAAVHFANTRLALAHYAGVALAVGSGTAAALRRAGVRRVLHPQRMDSEGLLALPELDPPAADIGLVGAPGGRGLLGPALAARGARVHLAYVYRRVAGRLDRRHLAGLAAAPDPLALLLTSADALGVLLNVLPGPLLDRLTGATVVAASPRLAQLAGTRGFATVRQAASARWPALCDALCGHAKPGPFR